MEGRFFTKVLMLMLILRFSVVHAQELISKFEVNGNSSAKVEIDERLEYFCMSYGSSVSWTLVGLKSEILLTSQLSLTTGHVFFKDDTILSGSITVNHPATCLDHDAFQCIAKGNDVEEVKTVQVDVIGC